jgi:hypothetical protein
MGTILNEKLTKDHSLASLTLKILKIATDDSFELDSASEDGWKSVKLKEIARITRIVRNKLKDMRLTPRIF